MANVLEEGENLHWKPKDQKCGSCGTKYEAGIGDLHYEEHLASLGGYDRYYSTKCPKCGESNRYGPLSSVPDHIKEKIPKLAWRKFILRVLILIALFTAILYWILLPK